MNDPWLTQIRAQLALRKSQSLLRILQPLDQQGPFILIQGQRLLNFSSNDYLGLAQHPHLKQAAIAAIEHHGVGSAASRLVSGTLELHARVEQRFAAFKHAQAALLFPTGYMANLGVMTSLAGPGDLICLDKLSHASLIDAAGASGAQVRVFPHLHYEKLERLLKKSLADVKVANGQSAPMAERRPTRRLIVTDSVFSMDGDVANLPTLCELADRHDAILMVDEAHGTGVLGEEGSGLCELQQVAQRVDVVISTASKALGGLGGIVTGCREIIDTLVNSARSFIYTTAVPPAQAATLDAAMDLIQREPHRRKRLHELSLSLRKFLAQSGKFGFDQPALGQPTVATPIIPLVVGSSEAALDLAAYLKQRGIYAPAIRPPTVPPQSARVRLSLRADLTDQHLDQLLDVLACWPGHHG